MDKYGKILLYSGGSVVLLLIVLLLWKKFKKSVVNSAKSKNFYSENSIPSTGYESISPSKAKSYAARIIKDLGWFSSDFTIYSDLNLLPAPDLIAVNNAYLENFAGEYEFRYSNIGDLINSENYDMEPSAIQLLKRLDEALPGFTFIPNLKTAL